MERYEATYPMAIHEKGESFFASSTEGKEVSEYLASSGQCFRPRVRVGTSVPGWPERISDALGMRSSEACVSDAGLPVLGGAFSVWRRVQTFLDAQECCNRGDMNEAEEDEGVPHAVQLDSLDLSQCSSVPSAVHLKTSRSFRQLPDRMRCLDFGIYDQENVHGLELSVVRRNVNILHDEHSGSNSNSALNSRYGCNENEIEETSASVMCDEIRREEINSIVCADRGNNSLHPESSDVGCEVVAENVSENEQSEVVGWHKRCIVSTGPDRRAFDPKRGTALQRALLRFEKRETEYIVDPSVGTEFDSVEEGLEYYNIYSWECGFGVRQGKKRYSNSERSLTVPKSERFQIGQEFYCSCAGSPNNVIKTASIRTNCRAMLRLHRTQDFGWVVSEHIAEHNHPLSKSYAENKTWPSHSHLDKYTTELVRNLRENNIGLTHLYSILGSFFGGMEKIPTTRSLKTLCQKINNEQAKDDITKTLKIFREFREKDPGFTYVVEPDEEGRIKTLMWTNSRSRMQYAHFGDVVTFDTTYKTNLYDMPFGLFVGVNNHFQTVLFGGVLLTDETIDSFKWVFNEFVSLMGGKAPKTILTDQARSMEVAIAEVLKDTIHRWCKWHVLHRLKESVGPKYTKDKSFRNKFHKMLNDMLTVSEFEEGWYQLLDEYGLLDNPFLSQIYAVRHKWVKCYFKGVFCARQTSTQRSESANHMLKQFVQKSCPIHIFVQQYAKLQYIRDEEETHEERRTRMKSRKLSSGGPIVIHASKIYTTKVYEFFCELKDESEDYKVIVVIPGVEFVAEHYDLSRVEKWFKGAYRVNFDAASSKYTCECGLFEHFGIPCAHSIRVMISCGIKNIPEAMIVTRWTRDARNIVPDYLAEYAKDSLAVASQTFRHSSLWINALEFVQMGDSNPESYKLATQLLNEGKVKLAEVCKTKDGLGLHDAHMNITEEAQVDPLDEFTLRAPKKRERGRPTSARDRAPYESLSKRPRHCKICRSSEHTKQNCPERDPATKKTRKPPTCSRCGVTGHKSNNCSSATKQLCLTEAT